MQDRAGRVWELLKRELRFMKSDTNILLVLLVGPVIYTVMFGLVYYGYKLYDVPIVVVDLDRSVLSRTIIRELNVHESIAVTEVLPDESELQQKFLNEECWGAVLIPPGLEKDVKRGSGGRVLMMTNTSNILIGNYVQKGAQSALGTVAAGVRIEQLERRGTSPQNVMRLASPVNLQTRLLYNPAMNYANFVVPLLLMLLVHQIIVISSAMSWAKELESGVHREAGVSIASHAFFVAKSLPYAALSLLWLFIEVIGAHAWLGIPFKANVMVLAWFGLLLSLNVIILGAIIGLLVKSKVGVVQVLFFTSMPLLLLSGGSWPLGSMPFIIRSIAFVLPSTHIMTSYRRMALEGAGFAELWPAFLMLLLLASGYFLLFRWLVSRCR